MQSKTGPGATSEGRVSREMVIKEMKGATSRDLPSLDPQMVKNKLISQEYTRQRAPAELKDRRFLTQVKKSYFSTILDSLADPSCGEDDPINWGETQHLWRTRGCEVCSFCTDETHLGRALVRSGLDTQKCCLCWDLKRSEMHNKQTESTEKERSVTADLICCVPEEKWMTHQ